MAKELHPIVDWKTVDWHKAEQSVYRLQKRIFRASGRGETEKVHNLQRKLDRSWYKWLLAVRKVTQDNQGKQTAGVDGVKSLTTTQRVELTEKLTRESRKKKRSKAKPVRRVWIPKPGNRKSGLLASPSWKTEQGKQGQRWPWNRNGRPSLKQRAMDSGQEDRRRTQDKRCSWHSGSGQNMWWTLILRACLIISAMKHCWKSSRRIQP